MNDQELHYLLAVFTIDPSYLGAGLSRRVESARQPMHPHSALAHAGSSSTGILGLLATPTFAITRCAWSIPAGWPSARRGIRRAGRASGSGRIAGMRRMVGLRSRWLDTTRRSQDTRCRDRTRRVERSRHPLDQRRLGLSANPGNGAWRSAFRTKAGGWLCAAQRFIGSLGARAGLGAVRYQLRAASKRAGFFGVAARLVHRAVVARAGAACAHGVTPQSYQKTSAR